MTRATSFILGYHGCERDLAMEVVSGQKTLAMSTAKYHWLGRGRYFWEDDPLRAYEWARDRPASRKLKNPYVIGAVIDLGHCLDLRVRENVQLVMDAYELLKEETATSGGQMPENQKAPNDDSPDKVLRHLDCAVINRLHQMVEDAGETPFDSVRSLFHEGKALYTDSGFWDKTHTEISVISDRCIIGYFLPRKQPAD